MKNIFVGLTIIFYSFSLYADISGQYASEFSRGNLKCIAEAELENPNLLTLIFDQWDEYCEDEEGNSYSSGLENTLIVEKIGNNKVRVTQGDEKIDLDAKIADFKMNDISYDFFVDTEDGRLEIIENFVLALNKLFYSSKYILNGEVIIDKSGSLERK